MPPNEDLAIKPVNKILVVEDDYPQLELICQILEYSDIDAQIFKTRSGQIALDIAQNEQPDVVLTDWHMPTMTGLDLIKQLKTNEATKDISVIMCTGVRLEDEDLRLAMAAGAVDYVRKPFQAIELLARVGTMLRISKAHQTIKNKNAELEKEIRRHRITLDKLQLSEKKLKQSLADNHRLARLDVLTELPNRRASVEHFQAMLALSKRQSFPVAVAIADIDNFKSINDKYGHHRGDKVLMEAGKVFKRGIRESDFVGRWGGEEFIFYFMDVDDDGALTVAESIRQAIAEATVIDDDVKIKLTVSIGLTTSSQDLDTAIKAADEALYRCKRGGRNQVALAADK